MTLKWSFENGQPFGLYPDLDVDGDSLHRMNPVTRTILLSSPVVAISHITPETEDEFYVRMRVFAKTNGPLMYGPARVPIPITLRDVSAHAGLTTNATDQLRADWLPHFMRRHALTLELL